MSRSNRILLPSSLKSFLVIHILLKALRLETVAPPIQQETLLFLGDIIFTLMSLEGISFDMLFSSLSLKPVRRLQPPATIMLWYITLRMSMSQLLIEFTTISWMPGHSCPILSGLNRISGALYFSEVS